MTLPTTPGTYALCLLLAAPRRLRVGRLGMVSFPAGEYVYVGRAFGPGGLRARVERHLRGDGRKHWHIDALRAVTQVRAVLYAVAAEPLECRWSQALSVLPEARVPVRGFGASDCMLGCTAHLIGFAEGIGLARLREALAERAGVEIAVHELHQWARRFSH